MAKQATVKVAASIEDVLAAKRTRAAGKPVFHRNAIVLVQDDGGKAYTRKQFAAISLKSGGDCSYLFDMLAAGKRAVVTNSNSAKEQVVALVKPADKKASKPAKKPVKAATPKKSPGGGYEVEIAGDSLADAQRLAEIEETNRKIKAKQLARLTKAELIEAILNGKA